MEIYSMLGVGAWSRGGEAKRLEPRWHQGPYWAKRTMGTTVLNSPLDDCQLWPCEWSNMELIAPIEWPPDLSFFLLIFLGAFRRTSYLFVSHRCNVSSWLQWPIRLHDGTFVTEASTERLGFWIFNGQRRGFTNYLRKYPTRDDYRLRSFSMGLITTWEKFTDSA